MRPPVLALVCAVALSCCTAPTLAASEIIPGTDVTTEELFLLPGSDTVYAKPEPGLWPLCLAPAHARAYRGTGISFAAGANPFSHVRQLGDDCPAALIGPAEHRALRARSTLRSERCVLRYARSGSYLLRVEMRMVSDDAQSLRDCSMRLALFILGYNGAAVIPDARFFRATSQSLLAFDEAHVGPTVPIAVVQLRSRCAGIAPAAGLTRAMLTSRTYCTRGESHVR